MYVLNIYKQRKQFILDKMIKDTKMNKEKIRFIQLVNTDVIILKNRKISEISKDLEDHNFELFDDSYNYLLNMRISNLTLDKIIELEKIISDTDEEIKTYSNITAANLWLNDLVEFEKYLKKGE